MEFHPLCLALDFREEVVDELAELMASHGWYPQEHITVYEGQILDGRHRYLAALRSGVEPQFMDFEGDHNAATAFVFGVNYMSRPWRTVDKKEFFLKARELGSWAKRETRGKTVTENEGANVLPPSHQEIADILGVDKKTVRRWEAERVNPTPIRASTSGDDEWYTPAKYIELARGVMGEIDLDPASCEQGQQNVQAKKFFTKEDDGLEQYWEGRVWMNPPYSKGLMDKFVTKLCAEYEVGHVTAAIVLTHNFSDTGWFRKLWDGASAVCLTYGRVKFESPDGVGNSPTSGHAFFYFGRNPAAFKDMFDDTGNIGITE